METLYNKISDRRFYIEKKVFCQNNYSNILFCIDRGYFRCGDCFAACRVSIRRCGYSLQPAVAGHTGAQNSNVIAHPYESCISAVSPLRSGILRMGLSFWLGSGVDRKNRQKILPKKVQPVHPCKSRQGFTVLQTFRAGLGRFCHRKIRHLNVLHYRSVPSLVQILDRRSGAAGADHPRYYAYFIFVCCPPLVPIFLPLRRFARLVQ